MRFHVVAEQLRALRQTRLSGLSTLYSSKVSFGIAALALAINLGLLYLYYAPAPKQLYGDENYYYRLAASIAAGEDAPQNLLWPPLYANLMGAIFSLAGVSRLAIQIVQIGMWFISAFLFRDIVAKLYPAPIVIHISFGLFLLSPELMAFSHYLWPETVHLFLWLLGFWLLICHARRGSSAPLSGLVLGLALLTKLLLLYFFPIILVFILVSKASAPALKTRLSKVILFSLTTFLTVLPVMLFNGRTQGSFVIADSSIFNLWVGLQDVSPVDYRDDIAGRELLDFEKAAADLPARNALYITKLGMKIQQQGLPQILLDQLGKQFFRLFDYQTFFTTQLPGGARQTYRFDAPALTTLLRSYSLATYAFILIAGMAGLSFIGVKPFGWAHCFLFFIAYNLMLFLFLHTKTRYVVQFTPMLIFFAAVALHAWLALLRGRNTSPVESFVRNKHRAALSIACSVLMFFIVFHSLLIGS